MNQWSIQMTDYQPDYTQLTRAERRRAEKYAKKLLQTVPALQDPDQPVSLRGAVDTAILKAENVMAARVFPDAENQWFCEVILRRGDGLRPARNGMPFPGRDEAVACLEHCIGSIKGTQEHPVVNQFRKLGIDPERIELLRVQHDSFGERWMIVPTTEISTRATAFAEKVELENGPGVDKLAMAFIFLHESAPAFATDPLLLATVSDCEVSKEWFNRCLDAAAFALKYGARTIYNIRKEQKFADLHESDFGPPASYFH
jgi:hypothetical protein